MKTIVGKIKSIRKNELKISNEITDKSSYFWSTLIGDKTICKEKTLIHLKT